MRWFYSSFVFLLFLPAHSDARAQSSSLWTLDLPDPSESRKAVPDREASPGLSWDAYFSKNRDLKKMKLGIVLEGSRPLGKNETESMLPASVQKVFTAAAALRFLGPEYRFENSFSGDFDPNSLVLLRPLFRISGDPTWGHEAFEGGLESTAENLESRIERVIGRLKASMVQRVRGPVVVESLRPGLSSYSRPAGWREEWSLQCMAMMQTEFQANGNCGQFRILSLSRFGWTTEGVSVPVRMKLQKSKEGSNSIRITPVFDSRGRIQEYVFSGYFSRGPLVFDLPVHQSSEWLRNLFITMLKDAGIAYDEGLRESETPIEGTERIGVDLSSRSMLEILQQAVRFSINGVMDRIFLEVGFREGLSGTGQGSGRWMEDVVRELVRDESMMSGVRLEDGSGLNLLNRIRPDMMHAYLSRLRNESYFNDFFSTLAVAGKSGTLLSRAVLVSSSHTYGKIHAKTGTLNGVTNLAGYFVQGPGGTPEPFVILSESDFSAPAARPKIDGIVVNFAAQNSGMRQN